jgi:hypothetical protein
VTDWKSHNYLFSQHLFHTILLLTFNWKTFRYHKFEISIEIFLMAAPGKLWIFIKLKMNWKLINSRANKANKIQSNLSFSCMNLHFYCDSIVEFANSVYWRLLYIFSFSIHTARSSPRPHTKLNDSFETLCCYF